MGNTDGMNSPLLEMILMKIRKSVGDSFVHTSNQEMLRMFFPGQMNLSGYRKISSTGFILGRTYLRPRDLVTYLNYVIRADKDNSIFSRDAIRNVERKYSGYLFKEIKNELCGHLSNEEINESLLLLKQFKRASFSYVEIKAYYEQRIGLYSHIDLDCALKKLFDFGVLGNKWSMTRNGKRRFYYSFAHRENVEIDFDKIFNVHLGLRKELNLS